MSLWKCTPLLVFDKVQMDTSLAYGMSTTDAIKMEDNPAYQTIMDSTGGGVGSGTDYYEDIIKMTQNSTNAALVLDEI